MRLKNKPWADDKLDEYSEYVVKNPKDWRGKWQERFKKKQNTYIEIGTGKGQFIIEMAKQYPNVNFIGVELQSSALVIALEKQIEEKLPNLQLVRADAQKLNDFFKPGEVNRIYLTFSDPWPKNRHEKRRLTYKKFLKIYKQILSKKGKLIFKTDNQGLFEYSLVSFSQYGMKIDEVYLDVHHSELAVSNVMTEFEEKFSKKGNRIYQVVGHF